MITLRALRLTLIVFILLCIMMTLLAVLLRTGHAQTTLTPGVTPPETFFSPLGLPAGPTFSTCSSACTSAYMACVNPCSIATSATAGTPSGSASNSAQCYLNCNTQQQSCTMGCSGLPFD
jgi:hypothetical protein